MRHEQDGVLPDRADPEHLPLQKDSRVRVERAERLVHEQDVGLRRQRPRDRDALPHAARKFVRERLLERRQPHEIQKFPGAFDALAFGRACEFEPQRDIVQDVPPGKQGIFLEHHAALASGTGDGRSAILHGSARCAFEPRYDAQERRLAAPRWADDADELVLARIERRSVDGRQRPAGTLRKDDRKVPDRHDGNSFHRLRRTHWNFLSSIRRKP